MMDNRYITMRPYSRASSTSQGSNTLRNVTATFTNTSYHPTPKSSVYSLDGSPHHYRSGRRPIPRAPSEWGSSQATLALSPPPFEAFLNWNPPLHLPKPRNGKIHWPRPLPEMVQQMAMIPYNTVARMCANPVFEAGILPLDMRYAPPPKDSATVISQYMKDFAFKASDGNYIDRSTRIVFAGHPEWVIYINHAYSIKVYDVLMLIATYLSGPDETHRNQIAARAYEEPHSSQLVMYQNSDHESQAAAFHHGQRRVDALGRRYVFCGLQEDANQQGWITHFASPAN